MGKVSDQSCHGQIIFVDVKKFEIYMRILLQDPFFITLQRQIFCLKLQQIAQTGHNNALFSILLFFVYIFFFFFFFNNSVIFKCQIVP